MNRAAAGQGPVGQLSPDAVIERLTLVEADGSPRFTNSKPMLGPLLQAGPGFESVSLQ
jgi:hypothetical protein